MSGGAARALKIDLRVDSERWKETDDAKAIIRRAVRAAAAQTKRRGELAIVLTDDSTIRRLNRDWRGVDAATNVLSFPVAQANDGEPPLIGDVVLAYETIAREARAERKPFAHHLAHLAVHGFLHLVGYDHEDEAEAADMEQAERDILHRLAVPDPYRREPRRATKRVRKT